MAARNGSTIGSNPLDQVVPLRALARAAAEEPAKLPRERVTIAPPGELMERARNAVWWTPVATLAVLMPVTLDGKGYPRKLDVRDAAAFTMKVPPRQSSQLPSLAYAQTACALTFYGKIPALKG